MFKITILLLSLSLHSSSVLCHESLHILTLHHGHSSSVQTIGVSVDEQKLNEVSHSILTAENWLRTNVLSYYPSTNITSVIVSNNLLCNRQDSVNLTVNSINNLHHSLTRYGLEREIKVSVSFSFNCLRHSHLQPVFSLLEKINSTYTLNLTKFSDQTVQVLTSELKSMNDFGVFRSETFNLVLPTLTQAKPTSRKLSFIDNLWSTATPPPAEFINFSPAPAASPEIHPPASSPSHPYGYSLPPCNPYTHRHRHRHHAVPPVAGKVGEPVAAPVSGGEEKLWCVAKPSVPSEKLQVALDYACGPGGADCGPIRPNGSCFSPDSVVAHASYAFNSYWQKNKKNGGICGFEGTAMLISTDPSYLHCHFVLS